MHGGSGEYRRAKRTFAGRRKSRQATVDYGFSTATSAVCDEAPTTVSKTAMTAGVLLSNTWSENHSARERRSFSWPQGQQRPEGEARGWLRFQHRREQGEEWSALES